MGLSIADFAEQLLTQKPPTENEADYIPVVEEKALDISNVQVPDDFISGLVESTLPDPKQSPAPTMKAIVEQAVKQEVIEEEPEALTENALLPEIRDLLLGLSSKINEMTSAGGIGMGAAIPTPKNPKKNDDGVVDVQEKNKDLKAKLKKILKAKKTGLKGL